MTQATGTHRGSFVEKSPVFYGWIVWIVATLGLLASAPGQSFTVSLFFDSFIEDFSLTRTTVSALYGLGTFLASLSLTWVGRQIDLHGNRTVSVVIGILFAVSLILWSFVGGPLALLIGFIAIRGLGQGALTMVNMTVVAQWFWRKRGRVMSLSLVAFGLFQAVYVPWLQRMLETYHWRQVWIILGIGVVLMVVPLSWLLMRNRPEEYDLLPDGAELAAHQQQEKDFPEDNWSLGEVMRTPIFWIFIFGRAISPAWGTGLIIHQVSIFENLGHTARTAAETYGLMTLVVAAASIMFGYLVDRMRASYVLVMQLTALITAMIFATFMTEAWMLIIYAAAFGLVMGGGGVFDNAVWVNLFGRLNQGSIRGFVTTTLVTGTAIGPLVFGLSYDLAGSYAPILWLGVILALIPLGLSFFVNKPRRRPSVASLLSKD